MRQGSDPALNTVGMDNVRNMTGSPIAGIDPHEFLDVRPLNYGTLPSLDTLPDTLERNRHCDHSRPSIRSDI